MPHAIVQEIGRKRAEILVEYDDALGVRAKAMIGKSQDRRLCGRPNTWEIPMAYTIKVNSVDHTADVDGDTPLLWVLRDVFGMTGTKFGCGMALCGACTVHMDGNPIRSCITRIDSVSTSAITTIEAIGNTPAGRKI